jgi:hypothetical protein
MSTPLEIPENITFEAAIAQTQRLMDQLMVKQLEVPLKETVAKLVSTRNGARGFFVAYLTDDGPLADHPAPEIVEALKKEPTQVSELLIKNLAMSTAMAITHSRNAHPEQAAQSLRVSRRSATLISQIGGERLIAEARDLQQSIQTSTGPYAAFLKKWGYDTEQQAAIAARLEEIMPKPTEP